MAHTKTVEWTRVSTPSELGAAIEGGELAIEVAGTLKGMQMITLAPGVRLRGGRLEFGAKGVRLTRDNILEDVTIATAEHEVAILNDTSFADLGTLTLRGVRTTGQVLLLAREAVRSGHVQVEGLTIESAELRGRSERPHGFGVDAMQGAFTLWNQQPDPAVEITAELMDVAAGSADAPVRGSGVFVGGHGDANGFADGGRVRLTTLRTGEIHADGGIPAGTDLISGGVFVVSGVVVDQVLNTGPVTAYGPNDMVLDNWGQVQSWITTAAVTSYGPSGIGFVNFGDIDRLDVRAPISTHGVGAGGFTVCDGSLRSASIDSISTTGDGAVGIQVSRELPELEVRGDLITTGGTGTSLVSGEQVQPSAIALSVKSGGRIGQAFIGGKIATYGPHLVTVEVDGEIGSLTVDGGIHAEGEGSGGIRYRPGLDLTGIVITAASGDTRLLIP